MLIRLLEGASLDLHQHEDVVVYERQLKKNLMKPKIKKIMRNLFFKDISHATALDLQIVIIMIQIHPTRMSHWAPHQHLLPITHLPLLIRSHHHLKRYPPRLMFDLLPCIIVLLNYNNATTKRLLSRIRSLTERGNAYFVLLFFEMLLENHFCEYDIN